MAGGWWIVAQMAENSRFSLIQLISHYDFESRLSTIEKQQEQQVESLGKLAEQQNVLGTALLQLPMLTNPADEPE
jgi:hypothetical protein